MTIQYSTSHLTSYRKSLECCLCKSCAVNQDMKVLVYMDVFGWVEFHIACVQEVFVTGSLCACTCVCFSLQL